MTRDANDSEHLRRGDAGREPNLSETAASDGNPRVAEAWVTLCAQAAVEQDPKRLFELVIEINRLLDVRRKRLEQESTRKTSGIDSTEPEDR